MSFSFKLLDRALIEPTDDINSVLSEGRFDAVIERRPARSYPVRAPRYE